MLEFNENWIKIDRNLKMTTSRMGLIFIFYVFLGNLYYVFNASVKELILTGNLHTPIHLE